MKQKKKIILSASIIFPFVVGIPVLVSGLSIQNNISINNNLNSTNTQQPVVDGLQEDLTTEKKSILDFCINTQKQKEVVVGDIRTILNDSNSAFSKATGNMQLTEANFVPGGIVPDFDQNIVNVQLSGVDVINNKVILTGLIPVNNLPITNVQQPEDNKFIPIDINRSDWDLRNHVFTREDMQWIATTIADQLYTNQPAVWSGVSFFDLEHLYIVSNIDTLLNPNSVDNVMLLDGSGQTGLDNLQIAFNNSLTYAENNNTINDGYLYMTFYLKEFISDKDPGIIPLPPTNNASKTISSDTTTNQPTNPPSNNQPTPSLPKQFYNLSNYINVVARDNQMPNIQLNIKLTGFNVKDKYTETQQGDQHQEVLWIIIGVSSGIGALVVLGLLFLIIRYIKTKVYNSANANK